MHEDLEAELRMVLAEGLVTREEVEPLREESVRSGKGPLAILQARGLISDATPTNDPRHEDLGQIKEAADRAAAPWP